MPAELIQATDGNFYGAALSGGANEWGTIFKISTSGTFTNIYSFCSQPQCADGTGAASLIQATDGNFYGTTGGGGVNNGGTIFRLTPSGTLTTLYDFCQQSCPNTPYPYGLIQHTDGTFYGLTLYGGSGCGVNGCGTIFKLSTGLGPFVKTLEAGGKVGSSVEILGTNLTGATSVSFHGKAATFTVVSASEITATVPPGATTGKIQVVTPGNTLVSNVSFYVRP